MKNLSSSVAQDWLKNRTLKVFWNSCWIRLLHQIHQVYKIFYFLDGIGCDNMSTILVVLN